MNAHALLTTTGSYAKYVALFMSVLMADDTNRMSIIAGVTNRHMIVQYRPGRSPTIHSMSLQNLHHSYVCVCARADVPLPSVHVYNADHFEEGDHQQTVATGERVEQFDVVLARARYK
jgi:hypothetical protein